MTNYYINQALRYLMASDEERKDTKEHWNRCHIDNLISGSSDNIRHSAGILAMYSIVDETPQESIIAVLRNMNSHLCDGDIERLSALEGIKTA